MTKPKPAAAPPALERVPLDQLELDPENVRLHGEKSVAGIAASLQRFGQRTPIVVDARGRVLKGNGTLAAARRLGWTHLDVVRTELSGPEARAYAIADNAVRLLSEWDQDGLVQQLQALGDDGLEGTGFSADDLDALARDTDAGREAAARDVEPEAPPEKPTSRTGDLWLLGDHRLLCGNSSVTSDIDRLMRTDVAALMSTDPPYCVNYTGGDRPDDSGKDWSDKYREIEITDFGEFMRSFLRATLPCLREDAGIYVWHAQGQYPTIDRVFEEFDILRHQQIIWLKPASTFTYAYYRWAHEPCVFGWRRGSKPPHLLDNTVGSVWEADWEGKSRVVGNEHPTQKPLRLFQIPIEQHTHVGDVVLEPFSGSGSQLIAAENLHRRCRSMEISPAFVDVAVRRWQALTGRDATLDGDGRTFAQVKAERAAATG